MRLTFVIGFIYRDRDILRFAEIVFAFSQSQGDDECTVFGNAGKFILGIAPHAVPRPFHAAKVYDLLLAVIGILRLHSGSIDRALRLGYRNSISIVAFIIFSGNGIRDLVRTRIHKCKRSPERFSVYRIRNGILLIYVARNRYAHVEFGTVVRFTLNLGICHRQFFGCYGDGIGAALFNVIRTEYAITDRITACVGNLRHGIRFLVTIRIFDRITIIQSLDLHAVALLLRVKGKVIFLRRDRQFRFMDDDFYRCGRALIVIRSRDSYRNGVSSCIDKSTIVGSNFSEFRAHARQVDRMLCAVVRPFRTRNGRNVDRIGCFGNGKIISSFRIVIIIIARNGIIDRHRTDVCQNRNNVGIVIGNRIGILSDRFDGNRPALRAAGVNVRLVFRHDFIVCFGDFYRDFDGNRLIIFAFRDGQRDGIFARVFKYGFAADGDGAVGRGRLSKIYRMILPVIGKLRCTNPGVIDMIFSL